MARITAVICHHKGRLIDRALETILESRGVDFKVIVVTSMPGFGYTHDKVRCLYVPGLPAHKRNVGSRFATGEYLAFFDDDTEIDRDALYEMERVLEDDPSAGMVFGKLKKINNPRMFDEAGGFLTWTGFIWARGDRQEDKGQFDKTEPIFAGKSAACMIRRRLFWRVGAFDPWFGILGEESDLAWRVWLGGFQVMYAPKSLTLHAFGTETKPVEFYSHRRVYFNGCRNYLAMIASNLDIWNVLRILPVNLMAWVVAGFSMLLKGKPRAGLFIFSGIFHFFSNLRHVRAKRDKVRAIRKVSDKELLPKIMRKIGPGYYFKRLLKYVQTGLHG